HADDPDRTRRRAIQQVSQAALDDSQTLSESTGGVVVLVVPGAVVAERHSGPFWQQTADGRCDQSTPANLSTVRIRSVASSESRSRPAWSDRRKISARWTAERPLSRPPTILKWSWWPFRYAANTTDRPNAV